MKKKGRKTEKQTELPTKARGPKAQGRVEEFKERRKDPPPQLKGTEERVDQETWAHIAQLLQGTDSSLLNAGLTQLANVARPQASATSSQRATNEGLALLHELAPDSPLEALLCMQMYGAHNAMMEFTRRTIGAQRLDITQKNASIATRFGQLWCRQAELLMKLRGQTGQQTVRVEHVTVEAGGQAIVGAVAPGGGGGHGE